MKTNSCTQKTQIRISFCWGNLRHLGWNFPVIAVCLVSDFSRVMLQQCPVIKPYLVLVPPTQAPSFFASWKGCCCCLHRRDVRTRSSEEEKELNIAWDNFVPVAFTHFLCGRRDIAFLISWFLFFLSWIQQQIWIWILDTNFFKGVRPPATVPKLY